MAWTAAEQTFWGQFLGSGSVLWGRLGTEILSENLEEYSGQVGDNARKRLGLPDIGVK